MTAIPPARLTVDAAASVGEIRRRLFGSFVEHLGRGVHTALFEPGHPAADERGFRADVLDLVRELGVTTVRYPGGTALSDARRSNGAEVDLSGLVRVASVSAIRIRDAFPYVATTKSDPDGVAPHDAEVALDGSVVEVHLPPVSWTMIQASLA